MDPLTPDELNTLCEIPPDVYVAFAMAVREEMGPLTLEACDREVLKRWYAREEDPTP